MLRVSLKNGHLLVLQLSAVRSNIIGCVSCVEKIGFLGCLSSASPAGMICNKGQRLSDKGG